MLEEKNPIEISGSHPNHDSDFDEFSDGIFPPIFQLPDKLMDIFEHFQVVILITIVILTSFLMGFLPHLMIRLTAKIVDQQKIPEVLVIML